ncbi:hypothetical protein E0Z10_g4873 [Xylaria hypoxylon]|uniref:Uncharacterized protein n=1 Tax=Xylaria hypoxylon TaxID=37992 RepID=A0A4Z0Z5M1_9PEZI|nr:hypothetical protein E0Z10_g4873 [Xylaria hypoxylon]
MFQNLPPRAVPDGGISAVAIALLCISQFADVIIHLEANPRALETTAACRNIMVGTCTGLVTAAAISCCRNLTEVLSIADDVVEIAFNLGLEAEKRSDYLEPFTSSPEQACTWATFVRNADATEARRVIDNLDVPSYAKLYISAFSRSTFTVSGPPSTMRKLFDKDGFLENCENISLPVRAAFHAQHLDPVSLDQLIRDIRPALLSMKVEHPFVVSSSSGDFLRGSTYMDLFIRVCEDVMQRPMALEAITKGLEKHLTPQVSCISFGPESIAHAIKPLLATHLRSWEDSDHAAQTGSDLPAAMPTAPLADPRDIAIIGMGVRLPGSETLEEFWDVLKDGRDLHERIPVDRFDLATHFDASGSKPNTTRTPYGMSPREARETDPQQRLLLLATYEALEMAGYSPDGSVGAYPGRRVGSFIGQTSDDWREVNASQDVGTYFIPGGMRAFGPGKLHYHFGWEGPSYSIDTACSGSASAIQLAVSSLLSRECDMAIGGGVNLLTAPDLFAGLCRGGFLSPTGGCKTFDDAADGYCRADAVGVVVLKRLSDALRDRDVVHAVLRGAMTNHSAEAVSITHPHAETQERLFSKLLTQINLTPGDINYVEMHGTGTQAGDATEMSSVINVLARNSRTTANPLYVGSVKPNLGHGEAGSGVTSLIKAVMMLRKSVIPPHIGIKSRINRKLPNMLEFHTHLSTSNTPFLPLSGRNMPRRILVNNFDAAGGNTSMVIQDPPQLLVEGVDPRPYHTVTICGKTLNSTHENAKRLLDYIKKNPESRLEDIAYTTTARRLHHHAYRQAYAVSSIDELCRSLEQTIAGNDSATRIIHHTAVTSPFVIFVFTGQGCQYASMASGLFNTCPPFRDSLEDMARICVSHGFTSFLPLVAGPDTNLAQASPVQVQTAIVAIELAMVSLWKYIGVTPDAVIGHSLGELAALCTAGVISMSSCLYLVGRRGMLMAEHCAAGTHAMLVVHESQEYVEKHLSSISQQGCDSDEQNSTAHYTSQICEIACINSVKSTVVSGPSKRIGNLQQKLIQSGVRTSILEVPFAFHSSQMDVILDDYEAEAEKLSFMAPRIPIASTELGTLVAEQGIIDAAYLRRQTRGRVKFSEAVNALRHNPGFPNTRRRVWIEVGADASCLSLVRTNLEQPMGENHLLLPSMRRNKGDWEVLASTVATAYKAGMTIDWRQYHKPFEKALQLLELPNYAFDLQNYWIQYEGDWSLTKGRPGDTAHACLSDVPAGRPLGTPGLYQIQSQLINSQEVSITFRSEVSDPRLRDIVHGHRVNGNNLYSSALYAEMAYTAARYTQSLANPSAKNTLCMDLRDMEVSEPLLAEKEYSERLVLVNARQARGSDTVRILFSSQMGSTQKDHAKCMVIFGDGDVWQSEWRQCASLVQDRIEHLSSSSLTGPTHRILGPMVYKLFRTFVDYDEPYRGMQEVYLDSKMQEASAKVRFSAEANDLFVYHPCWIDSLAHISGFVLNGTELTPADTVYISHGWKSMRIAVAKLSPITTYDTYVRMKQDPKISAVMIGDVYVIEDGHVIALIQDIKFRRIKRFQLEHFLPLKKHNDWNGEGAPSLTLRGLDTSNSSTEIEPEIRQAAQEDRVKDYYTQISEISIIFNVIAQEAGVEVEELPDHALLADAGVDSLLSLSIAAKLKDVLGLEVPSSFFLSSVSFGDLRNNLTEYYGLRTPSTEEETTLNTPMTSDTEEIPCNDEQSAQNSAKAAIELAVKANLLLRSNPSATERTVLFLFPDGAGRASSYTWLSAVDFGATSLNTIYGLDSPFMGDNAAAFGDVSLRDVVSAYIRAIRAVQPHGPYHLGGWSIGGVLAFEAASQLQGVSSLFLIDPPCPRVLEEQDGMGRTVYGFETAQEIIDIATLVHGNHNGSKAPSNSRKGDEDAMQAHFVGSTQMLERYRPLPLPKLGLRTTLLWAKHGVLETLEQEVGALDGTNTASNWILKPRQEADKFQLDWFQSVGAERVGIAERNMTCSCSAKGGTSASAKHVVWVTSPTSDERAVDRRTVYEKHCNQALFTMSPILRLVARIAEAGQESQVSHDGTYKRNDSDDNDDDGSKSSGLPWWAILLIVYFSILSLVFLSSIVYYWKRQKERQSEGQPFRAGYVFWKAFCAATGLGVWIWVFEKRGWCGSERKKDSAAGVGPYEKIRSRQLHSAARVPAPYPSPSRALPTDPNASAWYGAPASQSTTYTPYEQPHSALKPHGYNPAHQAFTQHDSIPMITLSPSPNLSLSPSPDPKLSYTPPPPYISPPAAALYGQNVQSQYTSPAELA